MSYVGKVSSKDLDEQNEKALQKAAKQGEKRKLSERASEAVQRKTSQQNADTNTRQVIELERSNKERERLQEREIKNTEEQLRLAFEKERTAQEALKALSGVGGENIKGVPLPLEKGKGRDKHTETIEKMRKSGGRYKNGKFVENTGLSKYLTTGKGFAESYGVGKAFSELMTYVSDVPKQKQLAEQYVKILDGKLDEKYPELKSSNEYIRSQDLDTQAKILEQIMIDMGKAADTPVFNWFHGDFEVGKDRIDSVEEAMVQIYLQGLEKHKDNLNRINLVKSIAPNIQDVLNKSIMYMR